MNPGDWSVSVVSQASCFEAEGRCIDYTVVRSAKRRKTMAIQIRRKGVLVRVPQRTPLRQVARFVESRAAWIVEKLREIEACSFIEKEYSDGEVHHYLGRRYSLRITLVSARTGVVVLKQGRLAVEVPAEISSEQRKKFIQENLRNWYYARGQVKIVQIVEKVAVRVGAVPKKIAIKDLKKSWGICRASGHISLNWRLVMAPPDLIEYIVLHELCHLEQLNHSKAFYRLVGEYQPDYKDRAARFAQWAAELGLNESI